MKSNMLKRFLEYRRVFFQDNKGLASMTRKMSYMITAFVVTYPFALLLKDVELTSVHVTLEIGLATIAFGGKVVQKKLSEKETTEPEI